MPERRTCNDHYEPSSADTRGHVDPCECALYVSDKTDALIGILDNVCYVNPPQGVPDMEVKSVSQCQQHWEHKFGQDWKQELRQRLPACIRQRDRNDKQFMKSHCLIPAGGDLGVGFRMNEECISDAQEDQICLEDHLRS